jgi:hypothetical protein
MVKHGQKQYDPSCGKPIIQVDTALHARFLGLCWPHSIVWPRYIRTRNASYSERAMMHTIVCEFLGNKLVVLISSSHRGFYGIGVVIACSTEANMLVDMHGLTKLSAMIMFSRLCPCFHSCMYEIPKTFLYVYQGIGCHTHAHIRYSKAFDRFGNRGLTRR